MQYVENRISPKDAVITASKYFTEITGYTSGVTIEEVELSEDDNFWLITLGYNEYPSYGLIIGKKAYKQFKINAITGDIISMKVRIV